MTPAEQAAFRAGAEAMREAIVTARLKIWPTAHSYSSENAATYRAQDSAVVAVFRAIRALPIPTPPEEPRHD